MKGNIKVNFEAMHGQKDILRALMESRKPFQSWKHMVKHNFQNKAQEHQNMFGCPTLWCHFVSNLIKIGDCKDSCAYKCTGKS